VIESTVPDDNDVLETLLLTCLEKNGAERRAMQAELCDRFPARASEIRERLELFEQMSAAEPTESDQIGQYKIVREIGRGGQGIVFEAEDTRLGRRVALKVLKSLGPCSEVVVLRFQREATVASKLDDPGICTIYDTGVANGVPFISMRYVEGQSLLDMISLAYERERTGSGCCIRIESASEARSAEDRVPAGSGSDSSIASGSGSGSQIRSEIGNIVALFESIARAVHGVHEAGVIHRDLKPANVMVTPDGKAVVMDFGLARSDEEDLPTLTRSGDLFGTPAYMSPEQLTRSTVRLDRRSDIWSLGVTLYECLTLHQPFVAPTREGLYQAILSKEPRDVRKLNPVAPKDLRTVVEVCLEKDRDRRYQTLLDLAEDLKAIRDRRPISARPLGPVGRAMRWARRQPYQAAVVVLATLFVIDVGYVLAKLPEVRANWQMAQVKVLEQTLEAGYDALGNSEFMLAARRLNGTGESS
jgi:eukaryotic-like serine/threonine-protein kinase